MYTTKPWARRPTKRRPVPWRRHTFHAMVMWPMIPIAFLPNRHRSDAAVWLTIPEHSIRG
jgi:hypothetical protein